MTQKTWGGGGCSYSPSLNTLLNGWSRKEYRFISIGEKKSDKEEKDYLLSEQENCTRNILVKTRLKSLDHRCIYGVEEGWMGYPAGPPDI